MGRGSGTCPLFRMSTIGGPNVMITTTYIRMWQSQVENEHYSTVSELI